MAQPTRPGESAVTVPAFLPFYRHVVPRELVTAALRGPVAAVTAPEHVGEVLDEIREGLIALVEGHAYRALIGEFHAFRAGIGLPMSTDSDEALRAFGARLTQHGIAEGMLDKYPVLRARVETMRRNSLEAFADVFTAYAEDKPALRNAELIGPSPQDEPIVRIFGTGSDPHNDNRQVIGLRLADGARVMYKPRALDSDRFVRDIYAAAEPFLRFPLRHCVPDSITVGSHGWQRFVRTEPMIAPEEPSRYFYRFGALASIFGAIGASDLHEENLLAAGEYPCVVDTETVIRSDAGLDDDTLPHALVNQLRLSVVSTMLVPVLDPSSPIDVVLAGVGVAGDQSSTMTRAAIRDARTDAVAVGFEPIQFAHEDNVPHLANRPLSATEHFTDVLAGYFDGLRFLRSGAITAVFDEHAGMAARTVLRATMIYGRFIDASTHPDYLAEPAEAERLFRLLTRVSEGFSPEAAEFVSEQERASLRTGNVPYFVLRGGSTELSTLAKRCHGVFKTTPLDVARRGVELNAARADVYHQFLLEECFGEVIGPDEPAGLSAVSVFGGTASCTPGTWWRAIADRITEIGVSFDGERGREIGWVCGIGPGRDATTITPGNCVSFHDTGGIVAFLERAARYDDEVRETYLGADRGLDSLLADYRESLARMPESVFSGTASLLLTSPSKMDEIGLLAMLDAVDARVAAGTVEDDLANGPPGLLMALLARPGGAMCGDDRLARLHHVVLSQLAAPRSVDWFDLAHGELGLRWACARAGAVFADEDMVTATADWLAARLAAPVRSPHTGWCNGAAGLLLASAEILSSAGRADWLTRGRLAAMADDATRLEEDVPVDLSVCHGSSGVVQSLLATARILGDDSLTTRAHEYQERVLKTVRANGFRTGIPGRTSLIGYMLGWAGIGDTDVLLHDSPHVPVPIPVALTGGAFDRTLDRVG
ncbi:type 2 lanthipeptide synthetase LanM [Amycolatopsis minnesotensis]|uniref:Lantibiotic biosynthesis protein dehydration domain-containing protein n=1 Tax=Amycolatopsis minnesotensis TaxID=337894 RepID=A0ABN2QQR2_9PSEU